MFHAGTAYIYHGVWGEGRDVSKDCEAQPREQRSEAIFAF